MFTAIGTARADEAGWIDLTGGNSLDAFRGKSQGWYFAKSVLVDAANPRLLAGVRGDGILVNGDKGRCPDLVTKQEYGDLEIRFDFLMPKGSNSGVKFHALYEIQLCDSFGKKKINGNDCGGVYPRATQKPTYKHLDSGIAPKINACKAPGEWQTLEAAFLAPRFANDGKKTVNAKLVRAVLNGHLIHENQELATPTGHNWDKPEKAAGPVLLQGDHGPVAFRNVRIRPWTKN